MNKIILVTGLGGYIGSVVTEVLLDNGYDVVGIDDLSEGNIQAIDTRVDFYMGNFGDKEILSEIFSNYNISCVIHLAASASVPLSIINPFPYYNNNVVNTINLLSKMMEFKVNNIIFSSTAAVFGTPKYNPIDENHPTAPISPYGHSKLMVEQILKDFSTAYGINYVMFRYLCVSGASKLHGESRRDETHIIPLLVKNVTSDKKSFDVYGNKFPTKDGTGVRDYFHVLDVADAHLLAIEKMETIKNNIFNLGNKEGYSVLEIINAVENLWKIKINYKIKEPRDGDPAILIADTTKAKNLLGWETKRDLNDILISFYNWEKNRPY